MRRIFPFLIVAAVVAVGCKPGHSVVGKWNMQSQDPSFKQLDGVTIQFTEDKSLDVEAKMSKPIQATVGFKGTYTLDNDVMTLKFTDASLKASDASKQKMFDTYIQQSKATILQQMNAQNNAGKIKWVSDTSFTNTDDKGQVSTFTKVTS